jgi:hypothetical protein
MKLHDILHATEWEWFCIITAAILDISLFCYIFLKAKKIKDAEKDTDSRQATLKEIDELMDEDNWHEEGERPSYSFYDSNYN